MKEQQFFKDPAIDRLMGVVMALAAEVYILKDRSRALEELLERNGTIGKNAVEDLRPAQNQQQAWAAERDTFVNRILEPILRGGQAPSSVDEQLVKQLTALPHRESAGQKGK